VIIILATLVQQKDLHLKQSRSLAQSLAEPTADYIESKTFQGKKEGYLFKKGGKGQGYYTDKTTQKNLVPLPSAIGVSSKPNLAKMLRLV
jgi:hypothetical protein